MTDIHTLPVPQVELINEPTYSFGSTDNVRSYPFELDLSKGDYPSSIHGVLFDGEPLAIFGSSGGCTDIHPHSIIAYNGLILLAVGQHIVCFKPAPFDVMWSVKADSATCFGIHFNPSNSALICHGELEISRISEDGRILWSASGADIFSEGFALKDDCIEAIDFAGAVSRFAYETGELLPTKTWRRWI